MSYQNNENIINEFCTQISHLTAPQQSKIKHLLEDFQDIFSTSNERIVRRNTNHFDVNIQNLSPVSVLMRRHQDRVHQLIDRYQLLGLLEPIDSPFSAATVERKTLRHVLMQPINIVLVLTIMP